MKGTLKRQLSRDDFFVIAANLLPVAGVWFLGWSATEVFIVYALETILIGFVTLLKLAVATAYKGKDVWYNQGSSTMVSGLFFMFFFLLHFGLFTLVQMSIFAQSASISPPRSSMFHFFFHWYEYINEDIAFMLGAFLISYLARTFIPFLINKEYKTHAMVRIMFQPYGRIFVQQFTVILGSMFLNFGWGKGFILVFALAKIYFEVMVDLENVINKSADELEKNVSRNDAKEQ